MNDALLNFMNKSIAEPEGKAFAEKVLDLYAYTHTGIPRRNRQHLQP